MGDSGGPITQGQDRRRDLRDGLHHRAVAEGRQRDLDRLRRRLRAGDARRRHDLEERDAEGPAGDFARISLIEASPFRAGHGLRRGEPLPAGRLRALRLPHRRLRRDLDEDRRPASAPPTSRARSARTASAPKLLYLGTEHGIYVSFDDGAKWQSLRQNLPDTPVHDIAVEERDLVIATHGRGFYIMDNIAPLRQGGLQTTTQLPPVQAGRRAARPRSQRRDRLLPEAAGAEGHDGVPRPGRAR